MPTTPLNVALIGYGLGGRVFHAPLIRSTAGLRLALVVSSDSAKVHRDIPDVPVAATPEAAFEDPEIGVVAIATPNATHYDLAHRALSAGKHVVVDKPFTVTVAEASALAEETKRAGRVLSVFQSRRWDGDFLTLRRLIGQGKLGEVVQFESHYDRYRPVVLPRWKEQAVPGSGIWYDLGPHLVDQPLQLFGMPEVVYADLANERQGAQAVDYFHVLLRYPKLHVILHGSNLVSGPNRRFDVQGTLGSYIKYGMDTQEGALRRGERPGMTGYGVDPDDGTLTLWRGDKPEARAIPTEPGDYGAFYRALHDAIVKGGSNPVPPEEGLAVVRIIELANRSAAERREVPVG